MKAHILDADALRAISPAGLAAFARGEGWARTESYGDHADVYAGTRRPEIILPRTDRLGDYASVVSRLVEIFAQVADRNELATYRELVGADRDVVRVRAVGADDDGSLPLEVGLTVVEKSRDVLLAAACAAVAPQAVYRAGANREANEYMTKVKLGQTEQGSFVVTLLAPVPPLLQPSLPLDIGWPNFEDEPMERRVTRRLVEALEASRTASEKALSGDGAAFDRAVASGVSANLCEAVAELIEKSNGLDVSVTWARTRPAPERHRRIAFSQNDAGILTEAARTFRLRQPKPDVTLFGTVFQLKRDQEEVEGVVTLKAEVDNKIQSVRAVLDQANYSTAVRAHDAKAPVIVNGDLERVGQRWQLTNASVRAIGPDHEGDEEAEPETQSNATPRA